MCAANLEPLEARKALEEAEAAVKEAAADKGRSIVLGTPSRTSDASAGGFVSCTSTRAQALWAAQACRALLLAGAAGEVIAVKKKCKLGRELFVKMSKIMALFLRNQTKVE